MAFGEVYTSLQTGVIDGYEHDASTTLQQRFHDVAGLMARAGHIVDSNSCSWRCSSV